MQKNQKSVLLISMPFAGISIPSIQLALLESYLKKFNINVKSSHLFLKASMCYGINNYNFLINSPNDSYTAQMVFSKHIFPKHWEKNKDKIKKYFKKTSSISKNHFDFNEFIKASDDFYDWSLYNLPWKDYDIIGFTLNYGQFLPSLAIAKKIKEQDEDKIIIFGGSRTIGNLGINTLKTFPYIDFIVSGDGEEALYLLANGSQQYESIPNLIYRKEKRILWNESEKSIDLNSLPIPTYDSFYSELKRVSPEIQQYFYYHGILPIEISRGCFWNNCTFCNLNIQYKKYREKDVDKIIKELDYLSTKYKILDFQFIGNTLPVKDTRLLCEKIIQLNKDFSLFIESRADQLKCKDYPLLKKAGFNNIQTGIESFSNDYLKKMNKGVKTIDNIATLKFCKENNIGNEYNLIVGYPNEEKKDYEETEKVVQLLKGYLDPPNLCNLRILYGSPIQCNPGAFGIEKLDFSPVDKMMFPEEILDKGICFLYDFISNKHEWSNNWQSLINKWQIENEMLMIESAKSKKPVDKYIFYFVDGGNFIRIYDKRSLKNIEIYNLDEMEREIFLSCLDVISFEKLKEKCPDISREELISTLETFEENNILFREDERYLALPLSYKKIKGIDFEREKTVFPTKIKENTVF